MSTHKLGTIFLMGFMGSGKSTLGTQLSRLVSMDYVDLDRRFSATTGKTISDFFANNPQEEFRKIESELLRSLPVEENIVVACGGGTPCFYDNIDWMNNNGLTIYLNVSSEFLFERLRNSRAKRPLISAMNNEELHDYIKNELSIREPFYKKAKMTISGAVNAHRLKEQIDQYYEFIEMYQDKSNEKTFHI